MFLNSITNYEYSQILDSLKVIELLFYCLNLGFKNIGIIHYL